ncbi:hypothetical protein FOZ62_001755 [Perkinsus olseni]|uniref:2-amino-3-carboxymuconate-6-semialdehyde decarboxylase n=1 Tax=Perkinsus olseni TaxID=32597 RepID=A0A7J6QF63_PEROL|nr:hypothetical protein FOZ62_001755 [Perkinsus olseni]
MSIDHPHPPGTARLAAVDDDAHSPSQHGGRQDLPKIDIHTHILPREWPSIGGFDLRLVDLPQDDELGRKAGFIKRMEWGDGKLFRKVKPNCIDPDVIMKECDSWGVHVQTVCTVPVLFNYHLDPTSGVQWSRFINDSLAEQVKQYPRRMAALGTLPLQHPEEAAKEMKRAVLEKGMRGFQIGSHINSWRTCGGGTGTSVENIMLNDERLMPIWQTAKSLNVGIFVHPWDMEWCWQGYWLPWLVGMPAEVSLAMCSVMLGGIIDKIPDLKVMFAHGGGSVPGTLGRIEWGWRCRPDLVAKDSKLNPRE